MIDKRENIIPELRRLLGSTILSIYEKSPKRIYIDVHPHDILTVGHLFFNDLQARMQTASGVHTPDGFEILYHWAFDKLFAVVSIRVNLPKENPTIESLSPIFMGAEWIEREMWELLGITFTNHPDMRHLLLMDDWPKDNYPMRRDYTLTGERK